MPLTFLVALGHFRLGLLDHGIHFALHMFLSGDIKKQTTKQDEKVQTNKATLATTANTSKRPFRQSCRIAHVHEKSSRHFLLSIDDFGPLSLLVPTSFLDWKSSLES